MTDDLSACELCTIKLFPVLESGQVIIMEKRCAHISDYSNLPAAVSLTFNSASSGPLLTQREVQDDMPGITQTVS